jgi:hypothetical protein
VDSSIKFFRDEYEEHVRLGRCPMVAPAGTPAVDPGRAASNGHGEAEAAERALGEVLG